MMKKLLFILLVMCNIIVIAQEENKEWCRPVKEDVELTLSEGDSATATMKFFQFEWFIVRGENNGDPKVGELYYKGDPFNQDQYLLDYGKRDDKKNHESLDIELYAYNDSLWVNVPIVDNTHWYKVIDQSNNRYIKDDVKTFGTYEKFVIPDSCSFIRISPDNRIVSIFKKDSIPEPQITTRKDTTSIEGCDSLECVEYQQLWANDSTLLSEYIIKKEVIANDKGGNDLWTIMIIIIATAGFAILVYFGYNFYRKKGKRGKQTINDGEKTRTSSEQEENPKEVTYEEDTNVENRRSSLVESETETESKKLRETIEKQEQEILSLRPYKENFDNKIKKIEAEKNTEIEKTKKKAEKEINKANDERDEALKKVDTISKDLECKFDKERKKLTREKDEAKEALAKKSVAYEELHKLKEQLANKLQLKENEVVRLEQGQQMFTSKLTFVPFATEYAKKIVSLLELSESIQAKIAEVIEMDIDDPYHIMKAVTKYATSTSTIDMKMFYTDVKMISEGQIALNCTTLAGLDQNSAKDSLDTGMRMYFFDRYLEKYVDALMVLNETMAGIHHLINGVPEGKTRIFNDYREQLLKTVTDLGLKVDSVKLFDKVGSKIGLNATLVDAGFSTGDILEIENCVVYFENGRRPETKIRVKVQE